MIVIGFEQRAALSAGQRYGLAILAVAVVVFGFVVELRGALQQNRKTDVGAFFRAAWAVRQGTDLYSVTDDPGWHYAYPPLTAIGLAPLADPPRGEDRAGMLPYPVSVAIWYLVSIGFIGLGVSLLAEALEDLANDPAVGRPAKYCQGWWALRVWPVLVCLTVLGRALVRGQMGPLILLLLCGGAAALLRNQRFRAGLWISAAVCVKVIPALLLLLPVWRRDRRMLMGSGVGLIAGLVLIPVLVMGWNRTEAAYRSFYREVLVAGVSGAAESTRGRELTGIASTESNSPMVVMHNLLNPAAERAMRPNQAHPVVRALHWAISALLVGTTLLAAGWRQGGFFRSSSPMNPALRIRDSLLLAALASAMLMVSPVFHAHYGAQDVMAVTLLMWLQWQTHGFARFTGGFAVLLLLLAGSHLLTAAGTWFLRDFGLVLFAQLALWAYCVTTLWRARKTGDFISLSPQQ
jgi:alpha-1,2-mannosyltransferase